jgi:tryptophanyl-tRNA synthetase
MQLVFSGIQPTADSLHLGNYLGAVKNWISLQQKYKCIYSVVDLHSLTVNPDPKELRSRVYLTTAQLLACGIDPKKSILFCQSDISEHAALTWYLSCKTHYGELKRMTQFKDKHKNNSTSAGLFIYPVLMAADVILYGTNFVPVGADQKQHLELTKRICESLEKSFNIKIEPKPLVTNFSKIQNLQSPENKMSKSDITELGTINIMDSNKLLEKKIKSAVTDSLNKITYDEKNQAGLANLINIYSGLTNISKEKIVEKYKNKMYGHLKVDLAKIVQEKIGNIRDKTNEILKNKKMLDDILEDGKDKAKKIAEPNYQQITNKFLGKTDKIFK